MKKSIPDIQKFILKFLAVSIFFSIYSINSTAAESGQIISENEKQAVELSKVWNKKSIDASILLFEKTADQWAVNNTPQKSVFCLNEAAKLALTISDYKTALRVLDRAVKVENTHHLLEEKVISLSISALIYQQKGDTKNNLKSYLEALNLSRKLNSPIAKGYAFFSAGMYNFYFGSIKDTIVFFQQADLFARQTQDIQLITQSLQYLGFSLARDGSAANGIENMKLAFETCEQFGDIRGKALSYFGIGFLYMLLNEKQEALENFRASESLFPTEFEWLERAKLYNNFGVIYEEYNDLETAESFREKAFQFFGKADYPFGQLASLPSLARIKFLRGDANESRKLYNEAISRAISLKDKFHLATAKEGIGDLNLASGNYDNAMKYYQEALRTYNEIEIKLPRVDNNLGLTFEKKGQLDAARNYYERALTLNKQTQDSLQATENLFNLARISLIEKDTAASLEQIKESISLTESLYLNVFNSKLKINYFSNVQDHYKLYINLLMRLHTDSPNENFALEALQAAEKSRARSMLENLSLSEANLTKDADAETIRREKEIRVSLNAKADKLTDLLSSNAEKSETDKLDGEINELNNELEDIKAKLKQNSPIYSAIKNPAPFDVGEFQRDVLDENSLLLEFSFGKDESYLWLVGKTQMSSYVLPPREQIETRIEKLRGLIASREMKDGEAIEDYQKRIAAAEVDYQTEARELSGQLFGQIADKLSGKRLIIVPDGKLHYFPVAALPLPNSASNEPILLTNETIYEPSAQTLLLLEKSRRESSAAKNLLVFSDPVFTDSDARLSPENKPAENAETASADKFRYVESLNSLARLTASKDESDSITNIVGASASDVYSGFAANRDQLLNIKTEDYKILHFATHGLTNEQRPELSGIILSRFDEKGQKIDESFRIHDIYGLNLNADLVVLSACETGLGKEVKGEGLMSLNNAFLQTGAKTVMASLWKVEDGATLNLMKNFYNEMTNENLTPSQALRQAQIKLRQNPQYQSPFYWAAFTVQGDFKTAPKISRSSVKPLYFLTIAPLILFGFYLLRKIFWEINYLCKYGRKHSL